MMPPKYPKPKVPFKTQAEIEAMSTAEYDRWLNPPEPYRPPEKPKNPHAVAMGKKGGRKGGLARARNLSKERRSEIARYAAAIGYGHTPPPLSVRTCPHCGQDYQPGPRGKKKPLDRPSAAG